MARFPRTTSQLHRQLVQESQFISRARVHEEIKRVHPFPPSRRRPIKHTHPVHHRHRHQLVGQLAENISRNGSLQVVPSGQIATSPSSRSFLIIEASLARSGETHGFDWGNDLRQTRDRVGDGGDGCPRAVERKIGSRSVRWEQMKRTPDWPVDFLMGGGGTVIRTPSAQNA